MLPSWNLIKTQDFAGFQEIFGRRSPRQGGIVFTPPPDYQVKSMG
jgi:hypothetical protein